MLKDVYVARTLEIPLPHQAVLPYVWNLKNIEYCEVKADDVQVQKDTERTGTYTVRGRFAKFVPWQRTFAYQLYDTGFHSVEAIKPASAIDIQGGFMVIPTGDHRCKVYHYEQYTLPILFIPLKPFIVGYLRWSQWKEMRDFKALVLKEIAKPLITQQV